MRTPRHACCLLCCAASAAGAPPSFQDIAPATGIDNTFAPAPGYPGEHAKMTGGCAVADFNRDGHPDIFAPSGGTAPDRLYINQGPDQFGVVSFADESPLWGCDAEHRSVGCAVGDVNRDGYPDLFVVSLGDTDGPAQTGAMKLYINTGPDEHGQCAFAEEAQLRGVATASPILDGTGAAFGDYDLDGDLDLVVVSWFNFTNLNRLFQNDGDGNFTDVTSTALTPAGRNVRGFQPRFTDLNGDLYPELLITGDFSTTALYVNDGPGPSGAVTLTDRRDAAGVTIDCNAMGSAVADFNDDLLLDWYITNIYTPPPADTCGNTLYLATGFDQHNAPTFDEVARDTGTFDGGWGWGAVPGDFDHDTDLDIAATGGWQNWFPVPSRLFINDGTASFTDQAAASGFDFTGNGRSLVTLDCEDDGDLDLLLVANDAELRLFASDTADTNTGDANWLKVRVDTHADPCLAPMAFGTKLYATFDPDPGSGAAPITRMRHIDGAYSYLSQGENGAHFGLGGAGVVDTLEIVYADGSSTVMHDVAINQTIHAAAFHPADIDRDDDTDLDDIDAFVTSFIAGSADIDRDGDTDLDDIDAFVRAFVTGDCP